MRLEQPVKDKHKPMALHRAHPRLTAKQFNAAVAKTRLVPDGPTCRACRLVLVEGTSMLAAARALGVSYATVNRRLQSLRAVLADEHTGRGRAYRAEDFRADQQVLGLTNAALAADLTTPLRNVEQWRADKLPVNPCAGHLLRLWVWLKANHATLYEKVRVVGQTGSEYTAKHFQADQRKLALTNAEIANVLGLSLVNIEKRRAGQVKTKPVIRKFIKTLIWLKTKEPALYETVRHL